MRTYLEHNSLQVPTSLSAHLINASNTFIGTNYAQQPTSYSHYPCTHCTRPRITNYCIAASECHNGQLKDFLAKTNQYKGSSKNRCHFHPEDIGSKNSLA